MQTRTIFCGLATASGVQKAENDKCDPSRNFETIKKCVGEEEECEGEWFSGPWGKVSIDMFFFNDFYPKITCNV